MRHALTPAVAAAAVILAGCSSGHPAGTTSAAPPTAAVIARQLGAAGIKPLDPPTMFAYSEVNATLHGHAVDIATFRTDQLRDEWVKVASRFEGIEQKGHLYAVADSPG